MSLQHELSDTRVGIPELDTTVFGATQYPVTVWSERNAEHKVLQNMSVMRESTKHQKYSPCGLRMCECTCRSEDVQE